MEDEHKNEQIEETTSSKETPQDGDNLMEELLKIANGEFDEVQEEDPEEQDNPTPEQSPEEEQEDKEESQEVTQEKEEKTSYTLEELIELGKTETLDKIDTSRIPKELQAVTKSLQAMATRRQQALADKEKELDAHIAEVKAMKAKNTQSAPISTSLQERLVEDAEGTIKQLQEDLTNINNELAQAQAAEDFFKVQELLIKKDQTREQLATVGGVINSARQEWDTLSKHVPNFEEKKTTLMEFVQTVVKDDPLTPHELSLLTNPLIMGRTATKLVRLVNNMYDALEGARKLAERKLKKSTPPKPAARAGTTSDTPAAQTNEAEVKALKARAEESGSIDDWALVIAEQTKARKKG